MDIDLNNIFSSFEAAYLEDYVRQLANGRLATAFSSSQDEKTQQAIKVMQDCLYCHVEFIGSSLLVQFDIDPNNQMTEFLKEYSAMKDQLEHEINTVAQLFLEGEVQDMLAFPEIQERIKDSVQEQVAEEVVNMLGGI